MPVRPRPMVATRTRSDVAPAQCEIRTGVGGRIRTRAQTTLRCGRATEERVCDAVGVAAAKTWVNVFAEGEEAAWCDLSTVDGAARCRLAREIRDEIDLGLPPREEKRRQRA